MPIPALVVDDEPLARKRTRRPLAAASDVTVIREAAADEEALRIISEQAALHGHPVAVLRDGTQLQMSRIYRERLDGPPR